MKQQKKFKKNDCRYKEMKMENIIQVYVHLLEEGTPTIRPTFAEKISDNIYKLMPTSDYDPEDEIWEFLPGSIIKVIHSTTDKDDPILLAVEYDDNK